jgi:hypothetical protein
MGAGDRSSYRPRHPQVAAPGRRSAPHCSVPICATSPPCPRRPNPRRRIAARDAWSDRVAGAVHAFGGEVLKFIGDRVVAIFPVAGAPAAACVAALRAPAWPISMRCGRACQCEYGTAPTGRSWSAAPIAVSCRQSQSANGETKWPRRSTTSWLICGAPMLSCSNALPLPMRRRRMRRRMPRKSAETALRLGEERYRALVTATAQVGVDERCTGQSSP